MAFCLLPVAYCLYVGQLAIARQQNLQTNAFDLGYVSQALWEDAHGQFFQFTTVQGSNAVIEGVDLSRILHPHWLLAFHVEPTLLLLAPFYRVWPDPRALLWLQVAVIAAGALPAALLARRLIGGTLAPFVFGVAWLLAPGLEGAALSDFHTVALGASLLMLAVWLFEAGHVHWALVCFTLTALCREDAALAVACAAGVLWLEGRPRDVTLSVERRVHWGKWWGMLLSTLSMTGFRRRRRLLILAVAAALWTLACFLLIEPFFSGGASAFSSRYAWLVHNPLGLPAWLASPNIRNYIAVQLLTGGIVAVLAPLQLLAALPLLGINALSNFDWMRSGGGHYSALLVAPLLWAAVRGVQRIKSHAGEPGVTVASFGVLACALGAQAWIGVSPLRVGFSWPQSDARAEHVASDLTAVPAQAPVSASSALYPHLSSRAEAYWFPSVDGADWLAVDAAGNTHPLSPADARQAALRWLSRADVDLVTADDGLLLMERRTSAARDGLLLNDPAARSLGQVTRAEPEALPAEFYNFTRPTGQITPLGPICFGPLALTGYQLKTRLGVGLLGDSAALVTYWQATEPTAAELHFALASTRQPDGALIGYDRDAAAAPLWLPTNRWPLGRPVRLEMEVGELRGVQALGVAVETFDGTRVEPTGSTRVWDGGTIAEVTRVG